MAVSLPSGVTGAVLIALLADGELHSGESLAATLGVSRAAVWKAVQRLRAQGIEVLAEARRGYRLPQPAELLDAARVRRELAPDHAARLRRLELLFEVDSTNSHLLRAAPPPPGIADVCASELQTAGRGRRGRRWMAPFATSLAMSLCWTFAESGTELPSLSLAVGVAVARALERQGAVGIRLKWPNDIWFEDRKIGGILIELRAEAGGAAHVVIGIGLNLRVPEALGREIAAGGIRAAGVAESCPLPPSRNRIAGAVLDELLGVVLRFERDGFAPLRAEWQHLDAMHGRPVHILSGAGGCTGIARGVDARGALLLDVDGQRRTFVSGDVSLRPAGPAVLEGSVA
jgi:BirA family biotin operon repressor/biotin-[acetyl-CoA-carboxylase] ligase